MIELDNDGTLVIKDYDFSDNEAIFKVEDEIQANDNIKNNTKKIIFKKIKDIGNIGYIGAELIPSIINLVNKLTAGNITSEDNIRLVAKQDSCEIEPCESRAKNEKILSITFEGCTGDSNICLNYFFKNNKKSNEKHSRKLDDNDVVDLLRPVGAKRPKLENVPLDIGNFGEDTERAQDDYTSPEDCLKQQYISMISKTNNPSTQIPPRREYMLEQERLKAVRNLSPYGNFYLNVIAAFHNKKNNGQTT